MLKTGVCPKCGNKEIIKVKDIHHSNGAGNICQSKIFLTENKCALITFHVCTSCGFVEHYLDAEEIKKLK